MDPVRVANIFKLAGAPFKVLQDQRGLLYEEHSPTVNAAKLAKGEVDVALIPAFDFLVNGAYQSLNFGLGCRSRSDSMVLYANDKVENLKTIHVYECSCSSSALLKLLLAEHWGVRPKFVRQKSLELFNLVKDRDGALGVTVKCCVRKHQAALASPLFFSSTSEIPSINLTPVMI
jgi:predicted solute-binding protein